MFVFRGESCNLVRPQRLRHSAKLMLGPCLGKAGAGVNYTDINWFNLGHLQDGVGLSLQKKKKKRLLVPKTSQLRKAGLALFQCSFPQAPPGVPPIPVTLGCPLCPSAAVFAGCLV